MITDRSALVRRGLLLSWITIGYNLLEAVISVGAGVVAGSVALVGFGVDSAIEVSASITAQWRLRADIDVAKRERAERVGGRMIGVSFLLLAAYVAYESIETLWHREPPERSTAGLIILVLSVIIMPLLARAKRRVADALDSKTLRADATQTSLCAYLSIIALTGVALNWLLTWWGADPVAALVMVPIIAKEGIEGVRGETCADCTP